MRILLLLLGIILLPEVQYAQSGLQPKLDALTSDPLLKGADISISVIDLESNQLIAGVESKIPLVPASSLKILTTATALAVLGPEYKFHTDLLYDGEIDPFGTLNGNIYIKGYGDPTLGSEKMPGVKNLDQLLNSCVKAIQKAGIKKVVGGIIADDSYFDNTPVSPNWSWSDIGNYYGAGAWALNIHENYYYLRFQQSWTIGSKPKLRGTVPTIKGLSFENDVVTAGSRTGDRAYIYGRVYSYVREVSGSIPAGSGLFVIKGSMPDAPLFTAQLLTESLEAAGISCHQPASKLALKSVVINTKLLLKIESPTLQEIVNRTNLESVNVYSEVLLRAIGKHWLGVGSREAGLMTIRQVWEDRGINWDDSNLDDGSGLSSFNNVSSWQLASIIRKAWIDPNLQAGLKSSLPIAGKSGTMRSFLKGTVAEGRLQAKTGSMKGVRSYTGIATNRSGKQFAFSIIVNNYSCTNNQLKQKLGSFMRQICE